MAENNPLLEIDGLDSPKEESNPLLQIDGLGETVPDVKKKEQTEPTQAAPLPGLGGVSEESTPSPSVGQLDIRTGTGALASIQPTPERKVLSDYEKNQKAISEIDKIISTGDMSKLPIKERMLFGGIESKISEDIDGLQRKRDSLVKKSDSLIPEARKVIDEIVSSEISGGKYQEFLTDDGTAVDPTKAGDLARKKALEYGLPDDGYFFDLVRNSIESNVESNRIKERVDKNFNDIMQEKHGMGVDDYVKSVVEKSADATGITKLIGERDLAIANVYDNISTLAKNEVEKIQIDRYGKTAEEYASDIRKQYESQISAINERYSGLMVDGQFTGNQQQFEAYKADFESISNAAQEQIDQIVSQEIKDVAAVNAKYDLRYKRQADEIARMYADKIDEKAKLVDPIIKKEIESAYRSAVSKVYEDENKDKKASEFYNVYSSFGPGAAIASFVAKPFTKSILDQTSTYLRAAGLQELSETAKLYAKSVDIGEFKLDNADDFLDPLNVLGATGQTIGGMVPTLVPSIAVGFATGGVGWLPTLAAGATGFTVESVGIAQDAYDDRFAATGNVSEAEEARDKAWKAQTLILPAYALDNFPIFGKIAGGTAKRIALGALAEYGTELLQEYPQNVFEEVIRNDENLSEAMKYVSFDGFKKTASNLTPVLLIGAGGQARQISAENNIKNAAATLSAKMNIGNMTDSSLEQYMLYLTASKGSDFALAFVDAQLRTGNIAEDVAEKSTNAINNSKSFIDKTRGLKISNESKLALASFDLKIRNAKERVEAETDPMLKSVEETKLKQLEKQASELATTGTTDYAVVAFKNNTFEILTPQELEVMSNNENFISSFSNGDIEVEMFGKNQKQMSDMLNEKVKQEPVTEEDGVNYIESLDDNELVTFNVETIEEVPDKFKEKAVKRDDLSVDVREKILGLPIGKKKKVTVKEGGYSYTITGLEAKEYAKEQQETVPTETKEAAPIELKEGEIDITTVFKNPVEKNNEQAVAASNEFKDKAGEYDEGVNDPKFKEENTTVEEISVDDIVPTQERLFEENLKSPSEGEPLVMKVGDKYYVEDGHHRIGNGINADNQTVSVRVYESDKAKQDAIQEQAAGEVPVQPEAKAGEKVEEGKPEAEPEKPTQKGKEEVSEEEVNKVADTTGTKPKNIRDLYNINRDMFGQDRVKSLASAIVMDRAIAVMAKRAGISKSEMYSRLQFKKAENVPDGVKFQVDSWHGSPYKFDKFTTQAIGTGEGAQAFGWGLYFTDLESIAKNYAEKLAKSKMKIITDGKEIDLDSDKFTNAEEVAYGALEVDYTIEKAIKRLEYNQSKRPNEDNLKAIDILKRTRVEGNRNLYKVSLHKGKSPSEYAWLEWDKKPNKEQVQKLLSKLNREQYDKGFYYGLAPNATNGTLYSGLSKALGGDKQASLFLLENGIDGIKYPAESVSRGATSDTARGFNYVVFDENAVTIEEVIKFQKDVEKTRGAAMVNMDGTAVIYAMTDPNVSTPLHEIAHVFEHYLTDAERKAIMKFAGTKEWNIETSEKFARGFEKYLADGIAPTAELQKIFDKFKQWMLDIYNGITGSDIDIKLNDEMRDIYDKMLGKEPVASKTESEKVKAAKDNLNIVWEKWKQSQKNLGVVFDPKSKANEDMELLEAFLTYIKALGVKTAKDIQKAFNDFTGGEATLDDAGAEFVSKRVKEPVVKKPVSIASETIGLTLRDQFDQGFKEYTEAIRKLNKEKIDKIKNLSKEKLKELRESKNKERIDQRQKFEEAVDNVKTKLKEAIKNAKDDAAARKIFNDFISMEMKELGISELSRGKINRLLGMSKNASKDSFDAIVDKGISLLVSQAKRNLDLDIKSAKGKLKDLINKGRFGTSTRTAQLLNSIPTDAIPVQYLKDYLDILDVLTSTAKPSAIQLNRLNEFMNSISQEIDSYINDMEFYAGEYNEYLEASKEEKQSKDYLDAKAKKAKDRTEAEKILIERVEAKRKEGFKEMLSELGATEDMILFVENNFERITSAASKMNKKDGVELTNKEKIAIENAKRKDAIALLNAMFPVEKGKRNIKNIGRFSGNKLNLDIANFFNSIVPKDLKDLSAKQIESIVDIMENIENGMITPAMFDMMTTINATRDVEKISKAASGIARAVDNAVESFYAIRNLIERDITEKQEIVKNVQKKIDEALTLQSQEIGEIIKGMKGSAFYEIISSVTSAMSVATSQINKLKERTYFLFYNMKGSPVENTILISLYHRAREFEMLDGNEDPTILDPIEYLDRAIFDEPNSYRKDILIDIRKKFLSNGTISSKDVLNEIEKRKGGELVKFMDETNLANRDKARSIAEVIRGIVFKEVDGYGASRAAEDAKADNLQDRVNRINNGSIVGSAKAGSINKRTANTAKTFDAIGDFINQNADLIYEYELAEPLSTISKTTSIMKATGNADMRSLGKVIHGYVSGILSDSFSMSMNDSGYWPSLFSSMVQRKKSEMIFSLFIKPVSESFAQLPKLLNPDSLTSFRALIEATKGSKLSLNQKYDVLLKIGSTSAERAGGMSSESFYRPSYAQRRLMRAASKMEMAYLKAHLPIDKFRRFVEKSNTLLQRVPDRFGPVDIIVGRFAYEFKKITGEYPDFTRIINDDVYLSENKDAIQTARAKADQVGNRLFAPSTPQETPKKGYVIPSLKLTPVSRSASSFWRHMWFLDTYSTTEQKTFLRGIKEMRDSLAESIKKDNYNSWSGIEDPSFMRGFAYSASNVFSMLAYQTSRAVLFGALEMMIAYLTGDDEEKESLLDSFLSGFGSGVRDVAILMPLARTPWPLKMPVFIAVRLGFESKYGKELADKYMPSFMSIDSRGELQREAAKMGPQGQGFASIMTAFTNSKKIADDFLNTERGVSASDVFILGKTIGSLMFGMDTQESKRFLGKWASSSRVKDSISVSLYGDYGTESILSDEIFSLYNELDKDKSIIPRDVSDSKKIEGVTYEINDRVIIDEMNAIRGKYIEQAFENARREYNRESDPNKKAEMLKEIYRAVNNNNEYEGKILEMFVRHGEPVE